MTIEPLNINEIAEAFYKIQQSQGAAISITPNLTTTNIAAPPVPAIELSSFAIPTTTATGTTIDWGAAIIFTALGVGVGYGIHLWHKNHIKNKGQKLKQANNIYDWKYNSADGYTTENSNNKHYTMGEMVNLPEHLFHPKVKEEPVLSPITTFMPGLEDQQYNPQKRTKKRVLSNRLNRPANTELFNGDKYNGGYKSHIIEE